MITPIADTKTPWEHAHRWPVRVYYEDTDAGGVVFYANYLKFMERARTEWLRSLGTEQHVLVQDHGIGFVVASLDVKYHAPAKLDDHLSIETRITQVGRASLNFAQRVMLSHTVLAEGNIRVGCVRLRDLKPSALPSGLHKQILQLDKR